MTVKYDTVTHFSQEDALLTLLDCQSREREGNVDAAQARIEGGHSLIEAKAALSHGHWLPFLERVGLRPRKAQRWMQLASDAVTAADEVALAEDAERFVDSFMGLQEICEELRLAFAAASEEERAEDGARYTAFAAGVWLLANEVVALVGRVADRPLKAEVKVMKRLAKGGE